MKKLYILFLFTLIQLGFSQQITHFEYWFGNDFANKALLPVTINSNNEIDTSITFLDNGTNEIYDLIHYRFLDSNNNWSSIYSQPMFNSNDTNAYLIQMEYWFDNDFANRAIVLPTQFMGTNGLDHQEADVPWQPNAQTIHYRFKSKYNQWSSIQSSNMDNIPNINNTIIGAEYWLNENFSTRQSLAVQQSNSFYQDIRNLILNTDVQETINLRYKDKMNRWSSIYSFHSDYQGDEIEPSPIGTVNLITNKLPAGKVSLVWNSVENAKLYLLYRDGLYWRSLENTHHPQSLEATDFPPLGNHTYYVVAKNYLNPTSITSNTDDETIDQADIDAQNDPTNTILYGTLNGMITDANGNRIDDVLITYSHDGYSVYSNLGQFKRDGILYGTEGNITLSKAGFSFTPVTNANYNITQPLQNLAFIGTSSNTTNPVADTQVFNLEQSSGFTILTAEPQFKQQFETVVTIKNIGNIPWSGKLQLIANKTGFTALNSHSIIDEVQVSNLAVNEERVIEFTTSQLELTPANYTISLLAYRFENDINSTIQNIIINSSITSIDNQITVENDLNLETLSDAIEFVRNAVTTSQTFSTILLNGNNSEIQNKIIGSFIEDLEVSSNYLEKANFIVDAINAADLLVNTNNHASYWNALGSLVSYCSNSNPVCKVIDIYMDISGSAIAGIQQLQSLNFSSASYVNIFSGNAKINLKVYKNKKIIDAFSTYFKIEDFQNQIKSVSFVLVQSNGFVANEQPFTIEDCQSTNDDETICLGFPPLESLDNLAGYNNFVKIIWSNDKITLIPFGINYFYPNGQSYDLKLDASKAGGNVDNIKRFVHPTYKT